MDTLVLARTSCPRRSGATRLRLAMLLLITASLEGCAAAQSIGTPDDLAFLPRGNTVIVRTPYGDDPFPTAQRYCTGRGLNAQARTLGPGKSSYDCV